MGYDRSVDYQGRTTNPVSTYEISSNESSDGEVQVIDAVDVANAAAASASSSTVIASTHPEHTTEVVVETSSAHEQSCTFNEVNATEIAENVPPASSEVVVESSDSECQFVLALKPPHLRTPEQVSLGSESDSDCIFVPNTSPKVKEISSDDSESDNIPLRETQRALKQEITDTKPLVDCSDLIPQSFLRVVINQGPSTSSSATTSGIRKYVTTKRKRVSQKSIFSSDTSSSSSSSSSSDSSDDEWQSNSKRLSDHVHRKIQKKRKKVSKKTKSNQKQLKPLSELPSSEGANNDDGDDEQIEENFPRIKSVIIRKNDNDQLYIDNNALANDNSNSDQASE